VNAATRKLVWWGSSAAVGKLSVGFIDMSRSTLAALHLWFQDLRSTKFG
jgi:hypothetical protein